MSEFEYWCEYGQHWVVEVRLHYLGQLLCKEDWQKICEAAAVTDSDQVWEQMQPVARVKELHPSFSFWEEA